MLLDLGLVRQADEANSRVFYYRWQTIDIHLLPTSFPKVQCNPLCSRKEILNSVPSYPALPYLSNVCKCKLTAHRCIYGPKDSQLGQRKVSGHRFRPRLALSASSARRRTHVLCSCGHAQLWYHTHVEDRLPQRVLFHFSHCWICKTRKKDTSLFAGLRKILREFSTHGYAWYFVLQ